MPAKNVTQQLIDAHLTLGSLTPDENIALHIDQTLTQDATGTLVMLAVEAMNPNRVQTEVSVQYVDHNLIQSDNKNPDDHLFLRSACRRYGIWYSPPGHGVSHPVHMMHFGKPGKTLAGSDSHTCAAGSLGMLAIGCGGLDVALAMVGEPLHLKMPRVWGVELTGRLPKWVSAKDVILEMLRRHGVKGGLNRIIEYHGPGLEHLSAMDRHVIANMGAELGATTTVFPADRAVRDFLNRYGRGEDFRELTADSGADYDDHDHIDLSQLEPMIAKPTSPGNVVPVSEVAGEDIYQAYIGSSANPAFRDFVIASKMLEGHRVHPGVSFDVNPTSRELLEDLTREGLLNHFIHAGTRIHQAGCNGCIGMGQAPATGRNSLRTVPRNFPGRSGTKEDSVFLCSPETATASAITGVITDPRTLKMECPNVDEPANPAIHRDLLEAPLDSEQAKALGLVKGPNIKSLPELKPLPDTLTLPVLLKAGDNVSTDEILPAGNKVLPFRSNIPEISKFAFTPLDPDFPQRAKELKESNGHAVVAGDNYGQGSSREHAALAPRYLGLRVVAATSFARIHRQNLINYGVLPLTFKNPQDLDSLQTGDVLHLTGLHHALKQTRPLLLTVNGETGRRMEVEHGLSHRNLEAVLAGSLINLFKKQTARRP
ncbi:aconitate hydratase [Nitrospina watsonii]|uniref:Aconitate hydratase n=1 Tax=Nitrospina watsonii TaxID=1323948 RepID=A0ABN8W3H9_9BACT|nr:aconitate hydratase [Nitrospina watsonii]CAI2718821.1 Aconitate hydratase [Nitrospina watsonii]